MSWLEHHRESERLASQAQLARREDRREDAEHLYLRAADAEFRAIAELNPSKARTLGISVVSAASLYYKATQYARAEEVAARWLSEAIPPFAKDQLRSLLQSVWAEEVRAETMAGFAPGQVLVSVSGGEVVHGGAPLDLITSKIKTVESLYHRTAEFLAEVSHRKRGQPSKQIQDICRPWLFQAAAGSYQFAVAVQEKSQLEMFDSPLSTEKVADCFLSVLRAGIGDPDEGLSEIVPDKEYRSTFLKLTRNLAPRGKSCERVEVRSADDSDAVRLDPEVRQHLTGAIRKLNTPHSDSGEPKTLNGVLRALHLDRDWLEVAVDDDHIQVHGVGEQVDDVIGPMVNKPVAVLVVEKNGKNTFVDIERND